MSYHPAANVDVYDGGGRFIKRHSFSDPGAIVHAQKYAHDEGEIIFQGRLTDGELLTNGPVFIPDDLNVGHEIPDDTDTVRLFIVRQKLPARNPLHPKALTKDELKPGMLIRCYSGRDSVRAVGIVRSEVDYRADGRPCIRILSWSSASEGSFTIVWPLDELGIAPYKDATEAEHWDNVYTLAV